MKKFKLLLSFLFATLLIQCSAFKDTDAFKQAQIFLENNTVVTNALGKITNYDVNSGSYKTENDIGTGEFELTLTGEKGKADVIIHLKRNTSLWHVDKALFTKDKTEVDLLKNGVVFAFFNSFFSDEKWGAAKTPAEFKPNSTVYFHGQSRGFKVDADGMVSVQLDVELTLPSGEKVSNPEFIKGPAQTPDGTIDIYYSKAIESESMVDPNPYNLKLTMFDLQTGGKTEVSSTFKVVK